MAKWKVTSRTQTVQQNATLMPEGYAGWFCKNIGTGNVEVDGYVLEPGETLDFLSLQPNCVWNTPISIVVQTNGVLRITRLQYAEQDDTCN